MSLSNKVTAISVSILLVGGVSLSAVAAENLFDALDTDQSGSISQSEARAHSGLSALFSEVDVNADGEITYAEFVAAGLDE